MTTLRLLVLSVILGVAPVFADQATRDPGTHFFNETFGDFSEELQNARAAGKKGILLMFEIHEFAVMQIVKDPNIAAFF